jgi:hypothetical protein
MPFILRCPWSLRTTCYVSDLREQLIPHRAIVPLFDMRDQRDQCFLVAHVVDGFGLRRDKSVGQIIEVEVAADNIVSRIHVDPGIGTVFILLYQRLDHGRELFANMPGAFTHHAEEESDFVEWATKSEE